jgi:hypothetical protein
VVVDRFPHDQEHTMSFTTIRTRLLSAVGATVAAAGLALIAAPTPAMAQPCTSCHGDYHGEKDPEVWLDEYEWDLENTYGQSDNQVMAGPDGQGDYRPHGDLPTPPR